MRSDLAVHTDKQDEIEVIFENLGGGISCPKFQIAKIVINGQDIVTLFSGFGNSGGTFATNFKNKVLWAYEDFIRKSSEREE